MTPTEARLDIADLDAPTEPTCLVRAKAGTVCGQIAVAIVTVGCVHEHITSGPVCRVCLHTMREAQMGCAPCWLGSDQHDCIRILAREESLT